MPILPNELPMVERVSQAADKLKARALKLRNAADLLDNAAKTLVQGQELTPEKVLFARDDLLRQEAEIRGHDSDLIDVFYVLREAEYAIKEWGRWWGPKD